MAAGRPLVCLPPAAPLPRGPCGRRSPPPVPGGAPLIAEPPRPAPPLVPAQLGSLTDSRSPPAGGRAEGSGESHAQPPAPPLYPARGRGGRARRRQQLRAAAACGGDALRSPSRPAAPSATGLRTGWLRAGQDDVESSRTAQGEQKTEPKNTTEISARRFDNFAAGRPRPEPQALKLWPPRRGPAGVSAPTPGERSRPRPAALLRAPGQGRGSAGEGESAGFP